MRTTPAACCPAWASGTCPSALSGIYLSTDYFNFQDAVFNSGRPGGLRTFNSAGIGPSNCGTRQRHLQLQHRFRSSRRRQRLWRDLDAVYSQSGGQSSGFTPTGSLGSWTITFTTESATATSTSLSTNNNGQTSTVFTSGNVGGQSATPTSVTFTATVTANGSPVSQGTVSFHDSTGTNPGQGIPLAQIAVNGSGQAQANVTFSASEEGTRSLSAVFSGTSAFASSTTPPNGEVTELTVNHPYNPSNGTTFCNGPVAINNSSGEPVGGTAGFPYPSQLVLGSGFSQLQGTIQNVTLTLNGLASEQPNFLGFLVQAPNGNAFEAMSFADGSAGTISSPLDLLLSDEGSAALQISADNQESCTSGSPCKPADDYSQISPLFTDTFPSPAPALFGKAFPTGSSTFTSQFGGGSANGTWLLYLNNWLAVNPPSGQVGSWCLNFTMQTNAHPTATSVSGSPNPASAPASSTASVALTANVSVTDASGLTVDAGTVSFVDGATTLGTSPVSNGQATLSTSLAEGTHQIVASYSGTDTGTEFGISTATFDQRVNTATTIPTSATGAGPYMFCNTGSIVAPGLNNDSGPASPYPSNIFVSGLPGTVKAVTVTLNGFTTKDQGDLLSLLVGPGGNNLDFFSLTGSNISNAPPPINLTFADGASSISGNLSSSGTFAPTSFNTDIAYPQCPPNAPLCNSPAVGPPLASNPFTPTNKAAAAGTAIFGNENEEGVFGGTTSSTYNGNGTWSLYLDDGGPTAGGEPINVNSGWCVALTQNLPSISVAAQSPSTFTQGGTGSFPVTITNEGVGSIGDPTATTANAMTVTDTLPTGLSYSGFTGTDWSCAAGGQTVVCTNEDTVAADANFNPLSINVSVSNTASGGSVNNTVTVSDAEASNNTAPSLSSSGAVTIDVPPTITSANSATFTSGIAGSFTVTTAAGTNPAAGLSESGSLPGTVTFTDNLNGTATLAGTPGASNSYGITITAQNGVLPNATQSFTLNVLPGLASRLAISVPASATAGAPFNFTVTAFDAFGNQATGYSGTIHFTSSDPGATLPANATLTSGTGTFSATLVTPGTQTITATDTVNPGLTNTSSGIVVSSLNFGSVNVCPAGQTTPAPCSNTQTFSFNIPAGTTIGSVSILTTGAANLDFQAEAGDTSATLCKAQTYSSATTCTVDVTFAPLAPGQRVGAVEILDGSGNVLATTLIYGTGTGPALAFNSSSPPVVLGTNFDGAEGVAVDAAGDVFVADYFAGEVKEMVAVNGSIPANPTINILGSGFSRPVGVAVDGAGNVYVADGNNTQVKEMVAVNGSIPATPMIRVLGSGFSFTYSVAVDAAGDVFVADTGNSEVKEMVAVNGSIPATPTIRVWDSDFSAPASVAVDAAGDVFVADSHTNKVEEIIAVNGSIPATPTINTLSGDFSGPSGVAVDAAGDVFVADTNHSVVKEIVAVNGSIPATNPTINLLDNGFSFTYGVAVDAAGDVFVTGDTLDISDVQEITRSAPPSLSFTSTSLGSTSSPQSVVFQNVGNATLTGSGVLSDTTHFSQVAGSGTPPDCTLATTSLAPGAECNLSIDFTPQSTAPISATITATDNTLNGNPATQTIQLGGTGTLATTTTTLTSSPNPSLLGQPVTFTATVTATGPVPTGTVSFEHLGFVLGTETLSNGVASFTTSTLPANVADHIVAVYSGSPTDTGSTSATLAQAVNGNPTTTMLTSSPNPSVLGQPVTFTATVSVTGHVPIGTVIFKHLGAVLATETLSNGMASFTTSTLPLNAADHIIAVYSGNATDAGSTSATLAQTVNKAPTTTTLMSSPNPSVLGQSVTFTATVGAMYGPVPVGTVRLEHLGALLGTGTLSNGVASITASALPLNAADHVIAVYSGSAEDIGSTSPAVVQTVH